MKLEELTNTLKGKLLSPGSGADADITAFYAGDFLSLVISRAPAGCAWFTVMNNINVAGVAALADIAVIVLCEGAEADETMLARCDEREIAVISTNLDVFSACAAVGCMR